LNGLNFPGKQQVNAGSHAEACAAVADWERKKGQGRVSKGIKGRKMTDQEYVDMVAEDIEKQMFSISDEEFQHYADLVDEGYDDEEDGFYVTGDIIKVDTDERLAFGWANVTVLKDGSVVLDKQGDFVDDSGELEEAAYDFVLNSRDGGEMHLRRGIGKLVESMVFTPEKIEKLGLPENSLPTGWWVGFRVSNDEVWKQIRNGSYRQFSIHGRGVRKAVED